MAGKIDYDRGVLIMTHPGSGMDVYMYVDSPGEYLTAHGKEVNEKIAKEAGYDVEKLGKEKVRLERRRKAAQEIDAEFEIEGKEEVVQEKEGFKVVAYGYGRHNVIDPDGNKLNNIPLTLDMALKLLSSFTTDEKPDEKKPDKKEK
jgi:hypothetical protein